MSAARLARVVLAFFIGAFFALVSLGLAVINGHSFSPYDDTPPTRWTWVAAGFFALTLVASICIPFAVAAVAYPTRRKGLTLVAGVLVVAGLVLFAFVFRCTSPAC